MAKGKANSKDVDGSGGLGVRGQASRRIAPTGSYFSTILIFLLLVAFGALYMLFNGILVEVFQANPLINGTIIGITIFGSLYLLMQVGSLRQECQWFENVAVILNEPSARAKAEFQNRKRPRLFAPLYAVVRDYLNQQRELLLTSSSFKTVTDSIANRIDERRDLSRYMVGVLVFLGLLGTFWGLLTTISGISSAISGLGATALNQNDASFFAGLSEAFEQPLSGMGTAFSSSLFGLAGSLIVGFVELINGQAHNRVLNDLEDTLSEWTNLATEGNAGAGASYVGDDYSLSETNATLDRLVKAIQRSEQSRMVVDANLDEFIRRLGAVQHDSALILRLEQMIANLQQDMYPVIVDTRSNLSTLVNSGQLADLNARLDMLTQTLSQATDTNNPDFLSRLDLILAALEQGGAGGDTGAAAAELTALNQQIQALRQELAAGRQSMGQQILGLTDAVRR